MLAASAALLAACGGAKGSDGGGSASTAKPAASGDPPAAATGATVKVVSSKFGRILADRRGQAFYLFGKEKSRRSQCYGDCAKAWPPALTKAAPRAGSGARRNLLGTTRRRDGKLQVTYGGRPLYYYHADSPGNVLCQNVSEFGGLWLVVRANGSPVR